MSNKAASRSTAKQTSGAPSEQEKASTDEVIRPKGLYRLIPIYLQAAAEGLEQGRLDEAQRVVDGILALKPEDETALDLRAQVLFRLERFDDCLDTYLKLQEKQPDSAELLVNLAQVEIRRERHAAAVPYIYRALEIDPMNTNAHSLLGLALARAGDFVGARSAFDKANQPEMLAYAEECIALGEDREFAVEDSSPLVEAASIAEALLEGDMPFAPDLRRAPPSGTATPTRAAPTEPPAAASPPPPASAPATASPPPPPTPPSEAIPPAAVPPGLLAAPTPAHAPLGQPQPLSRFATSRLLPQQHQPGASPFTLTASGVLLVHIQGRLPTRTLGAVVSTGQLGFDPLYRRLRGNLTAEPVGEGAETLFVANGQGMLVISPPSGRFVLLSLEEEVLYLREAAVFAFEESMHWESGRVPGSAPRSGGPIVDHARVFQFRGSGRLVLHERRPTYTLDISPGAPLFIEAGALLGWVGRVLPRLLLDDSGLPTSYVECTGEGRILLEQPGTPLDGAPAR